jgi:hypothetical protein
MKTMEAPPTMLMRVPSDSFFLYVCIFWVHCCVDCGCKKRTIHRHKTLGYHGDAYNIALSAIYSAKQAKQHMRAASEQACARASTTV